MQRTLRWSLRVLLVTWLAGCALLAAGGSAEAHAALVSSSPGDGAMIAEPPDAVVLRFDEPVDVRATAVRILSGSGETIRQQLGRGGDGRPVVRRSNRSTAEPPSTGRRSIPRQWSTTTADDFHPVSGAFVFSVGVSLQPGFMATQASGPAWGTGIETALRLVGLLGLAGAVGGSVLLVRLSGVRSDGVGAMHRLRRWTRRSAAFGATSVAGLGLVLADEGRQSSVRPGPARVAGRCGRPSGHAAGHPSRRTGAVRAVDLVGRVVCSGRRSVGCRGPRSRCRASCRRSARFARGNHPCPGYVDLAGRRRPAVCLGRSRPEARRVSLGVNGALRVRGGGSSGCCGVGRQRTASRVGPRPVGRCAHGQSRTGGSSSPSLR